MKKTQVARLVGAVEAYELRSKTAASFTTLFSHEGHRGNSQKNSHQNTKIGATACLWKSYVRGELISIQIRGVYTR